MRGIYLFFIVMFIFFYVHGTKSDYVINDDSFNFHTLVIDNLNSNNFLYYFSDIDVINIYPYVNPIYKDRLGNISYNVSGMDLNYDIDNFKNEYLSLIKKNSYLDYNYLYVNGINIDRVDVYLSDRQLYDLINNSNLIISVVK